MKWVTFAFYLVVLVLDVSTGLPINLDSVTDSQTQFLTCLIGVLLTVCMVVIFAGCVCCQRKSNGFKEFRDSPVFISTSSNLDHGHVNPIANGEFTIFTPLSPPHHNNNIFQINNHSSSNAIELDNPEINELFAKNSTNFPRNKLKYIQELGKGWFGKVVEGAAQDVASQSWSPVVVRILEATASSRQQSEFLQDAVVYCCHPHPNILKLIGRCFDTVPLLLLQESCPQDLKEYLLRNKSNSIKLISSEYPLLWCYQLSAGLKHLHSNKINHPDFAARNCLLTKDLQLKVGDYGLSIAKYPHDYYEGVRNLPVRWLAPESLVYTTNTIQPKEVTTAANVWSLGVTMWEICECGEQPYKELTDDEVISQVLGPTKLRLNRPTLSTMYTDYMYRLMQQCWSTFESRPAIAPIELMLNDLLEVYRNTELATPGSLVDDFDKRWETLKPNIIVKTDNQLNGSVECNNEIIAVNDTDNNSLANKKQMSPSLNNLLDDTSEVGVQIEPCPDKRNELPFFCEAEKEYSKENAKLEFRLEPYNKLVHSVDDLSIYQNSQLDSINTNQRASSESETEDENWKCKIERGAYSEKVRQKSRSVTDLMILTHIDCSESDSETPLPSLDYRINNKGIRYPAKHALEGMNVKFGSEGNLLSVQDTFQDELRKLQEERKDSLLFVPEDISQMESLASSSGEAVPPSKRLSLPRTNILQELSSTSELKPSQQVFNVFKVTIDHTFKPNISYEINEGNPYSKTPTLIEEPIEIVNVTNNLESKKVYQVPKLTEIIESNMELLDYIIAKYDSEPMEDIYNETNMINTVEENVKLNTTPELINITNEFLQKERYNNCFDVRNDYHLNKHECLTPNTLIESFTSENLQDTGVIHNQPTSDLWIDEGTTTENDTNQDSRSLTYSIETWDNFLGKTLDDQSQEECFSSFNSEPHSLLFVEDMAVSFKNSDMIIEERDSNTEKITPSAYVEQNENKTDIWDIQGSNVLNINENVPNKSSTRRSESSCDVDLQQNSQNGNYTSDHADGTWEAGEGWYLHPQSEENVSGEMCISSNGTAASYVGFNMDDEIMAAIRNELLEKLPQAQGMGYKKTEENEEWESEDRNEVFLQYNVYNMPLSPIPEEETFSGSYSKQSSAGESCSEESDGEWFESEKQNSLQNCNDQETLESSVRGLLQRYTPSQDSCCSNDTLFNLEELSCVSNETTKCVEEITAIKHEGIEDSSTICINSTTNSMFEAEKAVLDTCVDDTGEESKKNYILTETANGSEDNFEDRSITPLGTLDSQITVINCDTKRYLEDFLYHERNYYNYSNYSLSRDLTETTNNMLISLQQESSQDSLNMEDINEADITKLQNKKNSAFIDRSDDTDALITDDEKNAEYFGDIGILSDIRFSGPCDNQLMSTSFSESNELDDEHEWDSGSDTRSSSSGEFIWKEGEHEESVKALRAASFDVQSEIRSQTPEDINEEVVPESSGSDEEGDSPEFVPSAWDKFATPTKSSLRSPEKSNERKKSKGVSFKKQKYHCIYEYPKEPESPTVHGYDLWNSMPEYDSLDWEMDTNPYITPLCEEENSFRNFGDVYKFEPAEFSTDDFFISSSSKPFDAVGLTSQFFPGQKIAENWSDLIKQANENITPDSGVEDITPGDITDYSDCSITVPKTVQSLRSLAAAAANSCMLNSESKNSDVLGGLRHTRDKLKLDLPPSPSAFTTNRSFTIEHVEPLVEREVPSFTTFGKNRFLVQHVDTPEDQKDSGIKNVSFEALPYKPAPGIQRELSKNIDLNEEKSRVEIVTGEASVLDSADEDSGIESSTLERQSVRVAE